MIEHDAGAITAGPPAASALLKRAERTARSQCTLLFITENTQIVNEKISDCQRPIEMSPSVAR